MGICLRRGQMFSGVSICEADEIYATNADLFKCDKKYR